MKSKILILVALLFSLSTHAAKKSELLKDLDSLGSNEEIAKRSKAIDAENRIQIVQNRTVDRTMRLESVLSYDIVAGGDPYISSNNLGVMVDFHLSNKVSLGVRYYDTSSRLSPEGDRVFKEFQSNGGVRPAVDYPLSTTLGVVTFYPLYGKLNFFNIGVTQFDVYVLAGYGQISLNSGNTSTWTAGGGIGLWWSQHITSRVEVRYQSYQDKIYSGTRNEGVTSVSAGVGFLL